MKEWIAERRLFGAYMRHCAWVRVVNSMSMGNVICRRFLSVAGLKRAHRWFLLVLVLHLPGVAVADTAWHEADIAQQKAMKYLQCEAMSWEECKAHLAQKEAEELYLLWERQSWRDMHEWDEIRDIYVFLLHTAADKGYVRAQLELARHYTYQKDLVSALRWYDIAAINQNATERERNSAVARAKALRALPGEALRENILFLGAAALLLAPVFLPWGVQRNNRVWEILSALPNLFNGVVYMVRNELKHPILHEILTILPGHGLFWWFGTLFLSAVLFGVVLWRNRGRRAYIVTNAVLYFATIGTLVLILMAIGNRV